MQILILWQKTIVAFFIPSVYLLALIFLGFRELVVRRFDSRFPGMAGKDWNKKIRFRFYLRALRGWRKDDKYSAKLELIRNGSPIGYIAFAHLLTWATVTILLSACAIILPQMTEQLGIKNYGLGIYGTEYHSRTGFYARVIDHIVDHLAYIIHASYSEMLVWLLIDASVIYFTVKLLLRFRIPEAYE